MDLFSLYILYVSQFRARDGIPENCFLQMSSVHVHPRAYVWIINEMSKGKLHDFGKQSIQAKIVYRQTQAHTKKVNHDMERKQYIYNYIKRKYYFLPFFFFWERY